MTDTPTLPDVRTIRLSGVSTALAPISHSDGTAGTVALFRREKIAQPDWTIAKVPVVSGNALRGVLRDHAAICLWDTLGRPKLPAGVFDLLWSGGQLSKAAKPITSTQLAHLRDVNPMVSLFGGSGAGRIIEGRLRVGRLTPICAETIHVIPRVNIGGNGAAEISGLTVDQVPSCRDLLQIIEYSRVDDARRPAADDVIEGRAVDTATGELVPVDDIERDAPVQMRYGVETLIAGTRLHWSIGMIGVTDAEAGLLGAALDAWIADGSHIGGRAATGHGRLDMSAGHVVDEVDAATITQFLGHVAEHRDDIIDTLNWFA